MKNSQFAGILAGLLLMFVAGIPAALAELDVLSRAIQDSIVKDVNFSGDMRIDISADRLLKDVPLKSGFLSAQVRGRMSGGNLLETASIKVSASEIGRTDTDQGTSLTVDAIFEFLHFDEDMSNYLSTQKLDFLLSTPIPEPVAKIIEEVRKLTLHKTLVFTQNELNNFVLKQVGQGLSTADTFAMTVNEKSLGETAVIVGKLYGDVLKSGIFKAQSISSRTGFGSLRSQHSQTYVLLLSDSIFDSTTKALVESFVDFLTALDEKTGAEVSLMTEMLPISTLTSLVNEFLQVAQGIFTAEATVNLGLIEGVKISIDLMPLEIPLTITVNETFDYTYVQPVLRPSDEKTISMTALLESVYGFGEDTGKEDFNFYVYSISQRCDNYRCASAEVTQLRNVLTRQEIGWLSKYFRKQFQN